MSKKDILNATAPMKSQMHPQAILEALAELKDPRSKDKLVDSACFSDIIIAENRINITLTIPQEDADLYQRTRLDIERLVKTMPGAQGAKVFVVLTAHKQSGTHSRENPPSASTERFELSEIKNIIAIASGKGGVGKSTTTVNLAYALRDKGMRVGILDADIYGPSLPKMLSLSQKPETDENNHMIPLEKDGIQLISMGFLMAEDAPVIWRGPIVQKAIQQFLSMVRWSNIDILLIDMPPGTGDVHLTLVQKAHIRGAVIVSTPQDIALIDAKKAIGMFEKVDVPLLGLIENMSYFNCPHCAERSDIFSHGGAHKIATELNIPFLAEIPLALDIREMTDSGQQEKLVAHKDLGAPYRQAAASILEQLGKSKEASQKSAA